MDGAKLLSEQYISRQGNASSECMNIIFMGNAYVYKL